MTAYKLKLTWLVWIATLVRCLVALIVELGNDEVYYYTYAVQPDWNHFDHPPLVGSVIRFFTLQLYASSTFTMRLGAIICAMISTGLIFHVGRIIRNERTGFIAAILYSASIYTSIISGLFILPDSPATVFWLAAIYCMLKAIGIGDYSPSQRSSALLWVGLWIGLATLSKVHGVFLWFGFGTYILIYQRSLFQRLNLYLSVVISLVLISPILHWNIQNDFITWRFHGDRVTPTEGIQLKSFLTALIGQFLYANPLVAIFCVGGLAAYYRHALPTLRPAGRLLIWVGLPIIIVTTVVSLFRPVLPHWSGLGLIPMMLLAATGADLHLNSGRPWLFYQKLLNGLLQCILVIIFIGVFLILYYPGTLGNQEERHRGKGDFTLDMYGWRELPVIFSEVRAQDTVSGAMHADAALMVHKWFPGGHLYFYLARPLKMRTVGHGTLKDLHKFAWLNQHEGYIEKGEDAYFVVPSNYYVDPFTLYGEDFERIELAAQIPQERSGQTARYWFIYRLKNAKSTLGYVVGPGRTLKVFPEVSSDL